MSTAAGPARRGVALTLAIVGCLLAVVSVVAVWSRGQLLDTDRYLASVTPLAEDPIIQDEVATKTAAAINQQLDVAGRTSGVLPDQLAAAAERLGGAADQVVERNAQRFVQTDAFVTLWREINEIGHKDLVSLLTDDGSSSVQVDDGRLVLNLSRIADAARERLASAGLTVVTSLPPINLVVDIADAKDIEQARTAVTWLDRLATVLPILSIGLLALSVLLRGRVRRPLLRPAVMLAGSMLVLWLLVLWGASFVANNVSTSVASSEAVTVYYRHLTSLLRDGTVTVGLVAAAVALGALLWDRLKPTPAPQAS